MSVSVLDAFDLLGISGVPHPIQPASLRNDQGFVYELSGLHPYVDLFSPDSFHLSDDGLLAIHNATGKVVENPVSRFQSNETIVQVVSDEAGIFYAEIRGSNPTNDTFFVREMVGSDNIFGEDTVGVPDPMLVAFTPEQVDTAKLNGFFHYGDAPPVHEDPLGLVPSGNPPDTPETAGVQEPATIPDANGVCSSFKVIKIAIIYDSEFCGKYGSTRNAENRILAIVSSASAHYERDLCLKLQLTDIFSPDASCGRVSGAFSNFNFDIPCGGGGSSLLSDFTRWGTSNRNRLKLDPHALVHLFTGRSPSTGTIGCAWTGVVSFITPDPLLPLTSTESSAGYSTPSELST